MGKARASRRDHWSATTVLGKAIPREFVPPRKERARATAPSVATVVARITQQPCARAREEANTPRHPRLRARALAARAKATAAKARATGARASRASQLLKTSGLEAWPGSSNWSGAPEWPPAYGAQPPGPPPAPWLMAAPGPSFDPWSQWPTAPAAGAPPRAGAIRSLSSLARKLPVAPAPVPVSTANRYAVLGDFPVQPMKPRRGKKVSTSSAASRIPAYGQHTPGKSLGACEDLGGGRGGDGGSPSSSSVGHGGDGSTRTPTHALTHNWRSLCENQDSMCSLFQVSGFPSLCPNLKSRRQIMRERQIECVGPAV